MTTEKIEAGLENCSLSRHIHEYFRFTIDSETTCLLGRTRLEEEFVEVNEPCLDSFQSHFHPNHLVINRHLLISFIADLAVLTFRKFL
jgi:hypothetical protein